MDNKDFFNSTREVKLSGKTFIVSDITLGDLADFEVYCDTYKKKRMIATYELCKEKPNTSKILDVISTEDERVNMMTQIHGMIWLLHKILAKHQEISIEQVKSFPNNDVISIMKVITAGMIDPESDAEGNVPAVV